MQSVFPLPPSLTYGLFALLTLAYWLGAAFNVLLLAGFAYRSQVNKIFSRWQYVCHNWDTILVRVFVYGYAAFYGWVNHPDWVAKIAIGCGVASWIAGWLTIPITLGTSFVFGFVIDRVIDYAQSASANKPYLSWLNFFLRGRVPVYDANIVDTKKIAKMNKDDNQ